MDSSEVVGFILGFALGIVVFNRCRWVHSGTSWRTLGSSGVVVFTRFRPGGRCVHPGTLNSLGNALGVTRIVLAIGISQVHPGGHWVHPGLLGSLGSPWGLTGSSRVIGFTGVRNVSR